VKGEFSMPNKMRDSFNNKKQDGHFKKKNVKHDPQAESSRTVYDDPGIKH
jgi:hypothetical protein